MHAIANQGDVVTINETLLKNNRTLKIPGFTCFNKNRQGTNGGGIATWVKKKDTINTLKVFEGKDDEEEIITRHGQFAVPPPHACALSVRMRWVMLVPVAWIEI